MDNLKDFYEKLNEEDLTDDCFIAIYIHSAKQYCDEEFFKSLLEANIGDAQISIVDNSIGLAYYSRVVDIIQKYKKGNVVDITHIDVPRNDPKHQFLINVTTSLTELRQQFLSTNKKYFIILEADIIPNSKNWLPYLLEKKDEADVIGGLYYHGFHGQELWDKEAELIPTVHVLSGITLYKRDVVEKFPFRWSLENVAAFPDAWIMWDLDHDADRKWKRANYTKIKCEHRVDASGTRGHDKVN